MRFLFPIGLFFSASLLFFIQPMVAKALLPVYGGTPAVWTICMLFFQALLLGAYGYAWALSQFRHLWTWRIVHAVMSVCSLLLFPFTFNPVASVDTPELSILLTLVTQLGLPLLIVGSSAPLLQYAYSLTTEKRASDPYFLYVASNVGSLLALISYPWVVERYIGLESQFQWWSLGYLMYLLLLFWIIFAKQYPSLKKQQEITFSVPLRTLARWVFLSGVPCSLMLGVTFYISTDVGATPFFWVMPLALYLLSFVITFARKPVISHQWVVRNTIFVLIFPILGFILGTNNIAVWQMVLFNLAGFFMLALLCHGELVRSRPNVHGLTVFYFSMALGGVLAGLFNGLLAPRIFNQAYEYPLALTLAVFVLPIPRRAGEWWVPLTVALLLLISYLLPKADWALWIQHHRLSGILALMVIAIWQLSARSVGLSLGILFVFLLTPWFKANTSLVQMRNFYGIKEVISYYQSHALLSQSTVHGFQVKGGLSTNGAVAYYGPIKPVIDLLKAQKSSLNVSVLGLGAGILVCQFRAEDHLTLIEIDEQVIEIANNTDYFTYLHSCPSQKQFIVEDGRIAITKKKNFSEDLLVVDAFSSDAVPVHLLTKEAVGLYKQKIKESGGILFNISNRHLRLLPVLTAAGREHELIVLHRLDQGDPSHGQVASEWVLLTMNEPLAMQLMRQHQWKFMAFNDSFLWTDDYSNLIPLLKW